MESIIGFVGWAGTVAPGFLEWARQVATSFFYVLIAMACWKIINGSPQPRE